MWDFVKCDFCGEEVDAITMCEGVCGSGVCDICLETEEWGDPIGGYPSSRCKSCQKLCHNDPWHKGGIRGQPTEQHGKLC